MAVKKLNNLLVPESGMHHGLTVLTPVCVHKDQNIPCLAFIHPFQLSERILPELRKSVYRKQDAPCKQKNKKDMRKKLHLDLFKYITDTQKTSYSLIGSINIAGVECQPVWVVSSRNNLAAVIEQDILVKRIVRS